MNPNDFDFVVHAYTLDQAIADGMLVAKFENRWKELSGGKPIVTTAALSQLLSDAALVEVWNEYVNWVKNVRDTLPVDEQMFETTMNGEKVWVIEDGVSFTLLRPDDY